MKIPPSSLPDEVRDEIERLTKVVTDDLIALRRDLHAHPELGGAEIRTTRVLLDRLRSGGLEPEVLTTGTGVRCDVSGTEHVGAGSGPVDTGTVADGQTLPGVRTVALRADIDALPIADEKDVPYRSTAPGVCHACGHDVHAATVVGAGLVLGELARAGRLPGRVRLLFQPAEEVMGVGAADVVAAGVLDGVERIFALHCDPREDVGRVGLRIGGITASADQVSVRLTGRGGHTARPHLTADVVFALGDLITRLPAALSRRIDPRAGLSLVWGRISAGTTSNVIPDRGEVSGTVRCLDVDAWAEANALIPQLVHEIVAPYGVGCHVDYTRGVPPVVNEVVSTHLLAAAARSVLGTDAVRPTEQSLGGEDFAWYLEHVPGALVRLGVRRPGNEQVDLHRGDFDADERSIGIGVSVLATTALLALQR